MTAALIAAPAHDLLRQVTFGACAYALAAFALNVAGLRTLAEAVLLQFAARFIPFAGQTHAR
jgi:hypothetical protein